MTAPLVPAATIRRLILEAEALAGEHCCVTDGHEWIFEGGRACPTGGSGSQTVYRCRRCGEYDYGEPQGPGWLDCQNGDCGCASEELP